MAREKSYTYLLPGTKVANLRAWMRLLGLPDLSADFRVQARAGQFPRRGLPARDPWGEVGV
jgi:hypothetical protein